MYKLSINNFSGPLQKLLELIEEKELEITQVSLAQITADFLNYLKSLDKIEARVLADFVAVAAKLMVIKSKSLLPDLRLTPEEEKDIKDLEERLKLYKEFKNAEAGLKKVYAENKFSFSRKFLPVTDIGFFYPSSNLTINSIHSSLEKIYETTTALKFEKVERKMIDFKEYINQLFLRIGCLSTTKGDGLSSDYKSKFSDLSFGKKREEIIMLFLAVLYLIQDNLVKISQENHFSDIIIAKRSFDILN